MPEKLLNCFCTWTRGTVGFCFAQHDAPLTSAITTMRGVCSQHLLFQLWRKFTIWWKASSHNVIITEQRANKNMIVKEVGLYMERENYYLSLFDAITYYCILHSVAFHVSYSLVSFALFWNQVLKGQRFSVMKKKLILTMHRKRLSALACSSPPRFLVSISPFLCEGREETLILGYHSNLARTFSLSS